MRHYITVLTIHYIPFASQHNGKMSAYISHMILYEFVDSGNCYKIRMLLAELELPYTKVALDRLSSVRNTMEFLCKSPLGKVPVLEQDGEYYTESMAILYKLSTGTSLNPESPRVIQWLSFEQGEIQSSIGAARYLNKFCQELPPADLIERAHEALCVVEQQLKETGQYILGSTYSICDIALYAYIHLAPEAGVSLEPYIHIMQWILTIQGLPRYVAII